MYFARLFFFYTCGHQSCADFFSLVGPIPAGRSEGFQHNEASFFTYVKSDSPVCVLDVVDWPAGLSCSPVLPLPLKHATNSTSQRSSSREGYVRLVSS